MIPTLEDIIRGLLNGTMTPELAAHWLKCHEDLQAEMDDALGAVPLLRAQCLVNVIRKCDEQDQRWGPRTYPSFHPELLASADTTYLELSSHHGITTPRSARLETAAQDSFGELSWMTIIVEEVAKLCEKYENQQALREQLIDVAGVAVQWAAQLTEEPVYLEAAVAHATAEAAGEEADHEGPNLR